MDHPLQSTKSFQDLEVAQIMPEGVVLIVDVILIHVSRIISAQNMEIHTFPRQSKWCRRSCKLWSYAYVLALVQLW